MNILIAPDSLKGSLSALEFCQIVARKIQLRHANANLHLMPLADGGEGTIDAILANEAGKLITVSVQNALGQVIEAQYAILDEKQTAIIEMAQASGLPLIKASERNPMKASSFGSGELIKDALDHGCRRFIIGLGGSATNDGGIGMLQALGAKFFAAQQREIQPCGQSLNEIDVIDLSGFDSRLLACEVIIAGDVTNPLLGENGATYIFGPQKGADQSMLLELEAGMKHFAKKTLTACNISESLLAAPGAGAAGGIGFALMAYCQATMKSGFELIAEMADLDGVFANAATRPDLIITGEGHFDNQSLHGKLIGRLSERADKHDIPMLVICGGVGDDLDQKAISSNISAFSICQGPVSLEYAMENTASLLNKLMTNLVKIIFLSLNRKK